MRIGPLEVVVIVVLLALVTLLIVRQRRRRPAGRVLEEIFDEPSTPEPGTRAKVWALGALHEAGVDADSDPSYAMGVLRQLEPRLTPDAARALIDALNR